MIVTWVKAGVQQVKLEGGGGAFGRAGGVEKLLAAALGRSLLLEKTTFRLDEVID